MLEISFPFPPNHTARAAFCWRLWQLYRRGWRLRALGRRDLAGILGQAFAKAMETRNRAILEGRHVPTIEELAQAGDAEGRAELDHLLAHGCHVTDAETANDLPFLLRLAIRTYTKWADGEKRGLGGYTIAEVEKPAPDHGYARPDVILLDGTHRIVADYKIKLSLSDGREGSTWDPVAKEHEKYLHDWKMLHYCWQCDTAFYKIILVALKPRARVFDWDYTVQPDAARTWKRTSGWLWPEMSARRNLEPAILPGNPDHQDKWGLCDFVGPCLETGLDEAALSVRFVRVPRREH